MDVRARIGACRLLLQGLVGKPAHAAMSRTQSVALVDTIAATQKHTAVVGRLGFFGSIGK